MSLAYLWEPEWLEMMELERQFNDPQSWYVNSQWTYLMRELRITLQRRQREEDGHEANMALVRRDIEELVDHIKTRRLETMMQCQAETAAGFYDEHKGYRDHYSIAFMRMPEPGTDMNNPEVQEYWSQPRFDQEAWLAYTNKMIEMGQ